VAIALPEKKRNTFQISNKAAKMFQTTCALSTSRDLRENYC